MVTPVQLSLAIRLPNDITFASYYPGDSNAMALEYVERFCEPTASWLEAVIYLWGAHGVGRSHLLQAACLQFELTGRNAIYLPLADLVAYTPDILENLEQYDLVCLDDLQYIAGNRRWEEALFHLFNRLRDAGKQLLIAANKPPNGLAIKLADLQSRLGLALVFQLHALTDQEKNKALQLRAAKRGMQLTSEVANFMLSRSERDIAHLIELLDELDKASLDAQRKLTIPFVKHVFHW